MVFNAPFLRMPIDTLKTLKSAEDVCISHSGLPALFAFLFLDYLFVEMKCQCTVCNKISGSIACNKKLFLVLTNSNFFWVGIQVGSIGRRTKNRTPKTAGNRA